MALISSKLEGVLHPVRRLKKRLGPLWWYSLLMFVFARFGDLINLYIAMFLVPTVISPDRLGAVIPLTQLSMFVAVPLTITLHAVMKYFSVFLTAGSHGKIKSLLRDLIVLAGVLSVGIAVYLWRSQSFITRRLKFEEPAVLWMVGLLAIVSCWTPVARMSAQGLKRFRVIILSALMGPLARLVAVFLLLESFQLTGFLAGSLAFKLGALLCLSVGLLHYTRRNLVPVSYREHLPGMLAYLLPVGAGMAMVAFQLAAEPWIIRQRLPEADSAAYYVVSIFGNIPMYLAASLLPFFFPLVSEKHERGDSTSRMHLQALGLVLGSGGCVCLGYAIFGGDILRLHAAWRQYEAYAPFLWRVGVVTTLSIFLTCHITHENACRRFSYLWYLIPVIGLEVLFLHCSMGWRFFKEYLSPSLWLFVEGLIGRDLRYIVDYMLAARVVIGLCIVVTTIHRLRADGRENVRE